MTQSRLLQHSLARRLTLALVVMVAVVTALAVGIGYWRSVVNTDIELQREAETDTTVLAGALEIPLWNMDEAAVNRIGQTFTTSRWVSRIRISDNLGKVYFSHDNGRNGGLVVRTKTIYYAGRTIGSVEVTHSLSAANKTSNRLLIMGIVLILVVTLVLGLTTGAILRSLLLKPISELCGMVAGYAAGHYQPKDLRIAMSEFLPLGEVLKDMGSTITRQMDELQQAELKYRSIVENAVEGIFQLSPEGRFLEANPALARMLGFDSPVSLKAHCYSEASPLFSNKQQQAEFMAALLEGRTVSAFLVGWIRSDGSQIQVSLHARSVRDERGHLLCWEGTAEDITDRLRAAEEKAKLEDRLRQSHKIEAIGTLAGGIAHDFNNLLTPIIGYSQLAISNLPEVSPMRDDMVEILQVAERARDLVRQILVISRRDTGGTLAPVMFGPIIGEVLKLIGASIAPSIIIHFRVDPACGAVLGNASQLHQVVLNLCTNAVQAMEPDGGTLTVSLDHGCDGACPGRWVRLSVGDTGCGIPPQILPHIYEPYFTTKPSGRGSGLGLALVQGIVSSFGGEIRVSSDTGKGTVFDVYFPECEMVEQSVPNRGTMARGSGQRLLLVDDDRVVRKVLASLVRSLGYRPYECVSGADALEVFRSEPQAFDAVLTDYSMPGMSGLDLAHELHRLRPELPIIMGTGFADIDIKTDLTKNGITALIYKPYNIQILAESLLRIFPVAQPVQQAERLAL